MALILSNEEIEGLLNAEEYLDALEGIYIEIANGVAANSPRIDVLKPVSSKDGGSINYYMMKTMSGVASQYAAIRLLSDLVWFPEVGREVRKDRLPEHRHRYSTTRGLILLFSPETGELLAVMSEGYIRNVRVGAAAAIAARYLSREDAHVVGLLGSGFLAKAHLEALSHVRELHKVQVYSPNPEHCNQFAEELRDQMGIEVIASKSPQDAVAATDIVILATNSLQPVIKAEWLEPGMYFACVRHCEISGESFHRSNLVVLNSKIHFGVQYYLADTDASLPQSLAMDYERGYPPGDVKDISWNELPDLADLTAGKHPGRTDKREIICFNNSVGFGLQFTACAGRAYELAKKKGIGQEMPRDWSLDVVRPQSR